MAPAQSPRICTLTRISVFVRDTSITRGLHRTDHLSGRDQPGMRACRIAGDLAHREAGVRAGLAQGQLWSSA